MKNMKKTLTFVAAGMIAVFTATSAFATDVIKLNIDGNIVGGPVTPVSQKGRTLVPLRVIFEALDAEVTWDNATKTVTGTQADKEIILKMDDKTAKVDGQNVTLDVPGQVIKGSVYVPVRFIAESLGAGVEWNAESNTVFVKSEGKSADTQKEEAKVKEESKVKLPEMIIRNLSSKELGPNETRDDKLDFKFVYEKNQISNDAIYNKVTGNVRFPIQYDEIKETVAKEKNKKVEDLKILDLTVEKEGRVYTTLPSDEFNMRVLKITQKELLSYDLIRFENAYMKNVKYVNVESGLRLSGDLLMTEGNQTSIGSGKNEVIMSRPMNYINRTGQLDMYAIWDKIKDGNIENYRTDINQYAGKWHKVYLSEGTGKWDLGFRLGTSWNFSWSDNGPLADKSVVQGFWVDKERFQEAIPVKPKTLVEKITKK